MKTLLLKFTFLLSLQLISSCKNEEAVEVPQDEIFAEYELFYNRGEDNTVAKAKFKNSYSSGTTLKLKSPASITFNGSGLVYNSNLELYSAVFPEYLQEGAFMLKDASERTFINSVELRGIDFPDVDTISRFSDFNLEWKGDPLRPDEILSVIITGLNGGIPQLLTFSGETKKSVVIPSLNLIELRQGEAKVLMERTILLPLQQGSKSGGSIIGKYRSAEKIIYLK